MLGLIDMAVHNRGGGAEPDLVSRLHHFKPLLGIDLVGADDGANVVFRRTARQRIESRVPRDFQMLPDA